MCGRYTLVSKLEVISETFQVSIPFEFSPNPNISPGELAPVITSANPNNLSLLQFGLTPPWAQKPMLLINARSEGDHNADDLPQYNGSLGIFHKPAFRGIIRQKRCLVLADAFIEGPKEEKLSKPYLVFPTGRKVPFAFAGVWESWSDAKTGQIRSGFAIITTPATPITQCIGHHRNPLVLAPEKYNTWLSAHASMEELVQCMRQPAAYEWNAYPVSTDIKRAQNKDLELLAPTGPLLQPIETWHFSQSLKLEGMGSSPARSRRANDDQQLKLF
ncbi:MAG: SOS response-associated peptidase [Sphingobacteriaceae bacterium]|nr:SOS response-associated peptidase [Sphingobacteriaceae bacterium]